jgi:DNA-damage-inducible protein D
MDTCQIQTLIDTFEGHAQQTETGVEYWLARDLQQLLGYSKWENFQTVIAKARTACEVSGHAVENHFPDVRKMVRIKKVERRLTSDEKKVLKNPVTLDGE